MSREWPFFEMPYTGAANSSAQDFRMMEQFDGICMQNSHTYALNPKPSSGTCSGIGGQRFTLPPRRGILLWCGRHGSVKILAAPCRVKDLGFRVI